MFFSFRLLGLVLLAGLMVPHTAFAQDAPLLASVFQDHVVLQRDQPINVWGTVMAGETVTVELAGETATATADDDGRWNAALPAMEAGGPHTLRVSTDGGNAQTVDDVLVGDVFFCSGQSNMVVQINRTLNWPSEVRAAANDRIRMMTVGNVASPWPLDAFQNDVSWQVASPQTVANWSGTCYYFARELQQTVDVPMGLIVSAWGGSNIRAWMNADALAQVGGHDASLEMLAAYATDEAAAQQLFGEKTWQAWWHERTNEAVGTEPWQPATGAAWTEAPDGLGDWTAWDGLQGFTGMLWYRTTFTLTAEQAAQAADLSLGSIDEVDQTWINGQVVGNTFGYGTPRTYPIPAAKLREGENVVVVNVLNTWASGGLVGDPSARALVLASGDRVPLTEWRYQQVPRPVGFPPRTPWEAVAGLTTIHNAMVAPLKNFGVKAALWYQGESNTGEAATYQAELEALMAQWRAQFKNEALPVLVIQLANYGRPPMAPTESGWADVREAQRLAAANDENAALAVAIDIGDVYDIHPANKEELGRRLARAARQVVYGEEISPSGPVPVQATRHEHGVVVAFDDVEGALVTYSHTAPIGFELCGDEAGSCQYANAVIDGAQVVLTSDSAQNVSRVRYCWADSPICTLYDEAGLPTGPFEISITD